MANAQTGWYCRHTASIIAETNTNVTIRVTAFWQNDGWGYNISYVNAWVNCGGSSVQVMSNGKVNITNTSASANLGYHDFVINKGTAGQNISCYATITSNSSYTSGTKSSGAANVWVAAKPSYTVSYNANGGTGVPGNQTKWYGTNLTLSSSKPTKTGHSFKEWNTKADGTGTKYASGASYTGNAALTLYAIWTADTYAVTYNANGGTGAPGNQTKTYGVDLTLSATKPTKTDYNFLGWSTSANGGVVYTAGAKYTNNAAITLYAVWELAYVKPRLNNFLVQRCNSAGAATESGTYVKVTFDWATDFAVKNIIIQYKIQNGATWTNVAVTASGTSGSVSQIIGGGSISTETSYTVRAYVSDRDTDGTTYSPEMPIGTLKFPIDVKAGGKGIAFGKVAEEEDLMDVAFNAKFNKDVSVYGELYVNDIPVSGGGNAEVIVNVGKMIRLTKTASQVVNANTETIITYDQQVYNDSGGMLLHEKNGIRIGPNVSKILVEGQYRESGDRAKFIYILKNGVRAYAGTAWASSVNISYTLDVAEGDLVQLACYMYNISFTVSGGGNKEWDFLQATILADDESTTVASVNLNDIDFAMDALPIGAMTPYGNVNPPVNWLICDGSAVSRTEYSELFAVIGTSYGAGNGTSTFNLPNKKGRTSVGYNSNDADFNQIGVKGGEKTHLLTVDELPRHQPNLRVTSQNSTAGTTDYLYPGGTTTPAVVKPTAGRLNNSSAAFDVIGSDQPHNNMSPYEVDVWIIKAKKSVGIVGNIVDSLSSDSVTDALSAKQGKILNDKIESIGGGGGVGGDTLPINAIVDYDGDTVPEGYEEVEEYSMNEVPTGILWIDGKPIYRRVFTFTTDASAISKATITNMDRLVKMEGAVYKSGENQLPLNYFYDTNNFVRTWFYTNILNNQAKGYVGYTGYAIIEYTKTTD